MDPRIAVVTGGNRGLGLETCRRLAGVGLQVVLTSRDEPAGQAAAAALRDSGLDVVHHPLDVTDERSVDHLIAYLSGFFGRADVLVNNAGAMFDEDDGEGSSGASVFQATAEQLRRSMEVHVVGPLRLTQGLVPLMQDHGYGRIVNVSTGMASLAEMNGHWATYRMSKVALNGLTRIVADELGPGNVLVNSVCPGWVRTGMGGAQATRSVEEGAEGIVWAATLPDGGPQGGFFRDGEPVPW